MRFKNIFIFFVALFLFASKTEAKLIVVTTTTDLKSIAQEVGGEQVEVIALAKGYEDLHFVTPTLRLMSVANKADLFVSIGLDLELWVERVLEGARNPKIAVGAKGHVVASEGVPVRELPKTLTRAEGDLHPFGNPHIWLDPLNIKIIATNIADGLKRVSPENSDYFDQQLKSFQRRISEAMYGKKLVGLFGADLLDNLARKDRLISFLETKTLSPGLQKKLGVTKLIELLDGWMKMALPLRGKKIIFYHKIWIYFTSRFGLEIAAYVEEKPGISPSSAHKEYLLQKIKENNIKVLALANYYNDSVSRSLASQTGGKVVVLPISTEGIPECKDYFALMDYIIKSLVEAYK